MMRLQKSTIPAVLTEHAVEWTRELLDLLGRGLEPARSIWRRYAHPTVKTAVTVDSFGKCIYCESKVLHVSHGDIEHIKPKKRFPKLTYEWTNLALVCSRCNNHKRDGFDESCPPVNPFTEDPDQFLCAIGEWIWPKAGIDRGQVTIDLVDLNRVELLERRRERLKQIRDATEAWARTRNPKVKESFAEHLRDELSSEKEYVFVARAVLGPLGANELLP